MESRSGIEYDYSNPVVMAVTNSIAILCVCNLLVRSTSRTLIANVPYTVDIYT